MEPTERKEDETDETRRPQNPQGEVMGNVLAHKTLRWYVCSQCFGDLVQVELDADNSAVTCPDCGPGQGFVSRRWAEQRTTDAHFEKMDAVHTLQQMGALVNPHKGKSEAQLLAEMGF